MRIDLEEFVSDYLALDGAEKDTNRQIATQYVDAAAEGPMTKAEFKAEVTRIAKQLPYYTGREK